MHLPIPGAPEGLRASMVTSVERVSALLPRRIPWRASRTDVAGQEVNRFETGKFRGNERAPRAEVLSGLSAFPLLVRVSEGGFEPPRPVKVTRPST